MSKSHEATLYRALNGEGSSGSDVAAIRAAAEKQYADLDLPSWRRSGFWTTSLRSLNLEELKPKHYTESDQLPDVVETTLADDQLSGLLIQHGASVVKTELDEELKEKGVILCSLEEAQAKHSELFQRYFMQRLRYDRDKFEAACAAFWQGGAFLYVPPNVVIEQPIQIVYTISEPGTIQYAHTLAIGGEGANFKLREYDLAPDFSGQAAHAGAFELYLEANANCQLSHFQDWGKGEVYDASTHVAVAERDAHCTWIPVHLGGHLTRQHLELVTAEAGADTLFRGIYFTEGDEHLDLFAVDLHESGNTTGDVHWKGAASGKSRASYEGLIQINPGAQDTHTYLQTHTMMLSKKAKVDAIPSVLVSADQVSASHGGTIGEIDQDLVFYMMSRGLSRSEATRLIIEGFFEPIITQLKDPGLEEQIRTRVASKLAAAAAEVEQYIANR